MSAQPGIGADCKAYYSTGTYAAPVWVEIDEAIDVSIVEFNDTMVEIVTRASDFAGNRPAKTRVAVEMSYLYKANTTVFDALRTQKLAKSAVDFAILDGDIVTVGTEGLRFYAYIETFPIGQALEEAVTLDTIRLANALHFDAGTRREPTWHITPTPP